MNSAGIASEATELWRTIGAKAPAGLLRLWENHEQSPARFTIGWQFQRGKAGFRNHGTDNVI